MTGFIYPMEGSWTWGGEAVFGMYTLGDLGFSDFAGSGIVHMAGAAAALAGVILLGAREGKYSADGKPRAIPGANLPLATLGTFILWMGWFGFNGGSVLATATVESANAVAVVFMNTNAAAAGGLIAALIVARILFGKADLTMALNGALAGLVAITAEPSTPTALQATLFGGIGGVLVVFSILALDKLKLDDPVGAISVHGVVGLLGLLLVPVTNGDNASFSGQLIGALTIFVWVFVTSGIVWLWVSVLALKKNSKALICQNVVWKRTQNSQNKICKFFLRKGRLRNQSPFFMFRRSCPWAMSGQIIAPAFICTSTIHGGRMLRASWMRKSSVSRTPRFLLSVKEYAKTHVNNGEAFSSISMNE